MITPERWQRVKAIFLAAQSSAPAERAAFLDEACNGDEDVRGEVESLLAADLTNDDFLSAPAYELAAEMLAEEKPEFVDEVLPSSGLNQMLAVADYVVLAAPVTPASTGMIGREQLADMKSDAYLINVGRGSLIDEAALLEVLQQRKIGGAALDVFDQEPLPPDSPLWDLDNLLITPHTAGMTARLWQRHYSLFSENLRRYLSGQPLLALVDKKSGY